MEIINFWIAITPRLVDDFDIAEAGVYEHFRKAGAISGHTVRMLARHMPIPEGTTPFCTDQTEFFIWNCYSKNDANIDLIGKDLDAIMTAYSGEFIVIGAWHFNKADNGMGLELGTYIRNGCVVGAPKFIQPPVLLAKIIKDRPNDGALVAGQAPRVFSAF